MGEIIAENGDRAADWDQDRDIEDRLGGDATNSDLRPKAQAEVLRRCHHAGKVCRLRDNRELYGKGSKALEGRKTRKDKAKEKRRKGGRRLSGPGLAFVTGILNIIIQTYDI